MSAARAAQWHRVADSRGQRGGADRLTAEGNDGRQRPAEGRHTHNSTSQGWAPNGWQRAAIDVCACQDTCKNTHAHNHSFALAKKRWLLIHTCVNTCTHTDTQTHRHTDTHTRTHALDCICLEVTAFHPYIHAKHRTLARMQTCLRMHMCSFACMNTAPRAGQCANLTCRPRWRSCSASCYCHTNCNTVKIMLAQSIERIGNKEYV